MAKKLRSATGLREVSPNVWEMYASAGRDPVTGKYRQVSEFFHGGLREAKTARAEFAIAAKKGRHTGSTATVETLCKEWLTELRRKGRSPTTIDEYERRYKHDIHAAIGHLPVTKVSTKMLTDLYGAYQETGTSAISVRKIHATVSSMMTQACKWGWRNNNPAEWADPPPIPDVVPNVPTPDEVAKLLAASKASNRPIYESIIFLAATTGARRGEICGLRRSDIDVKQSTLLIARGVVKRKDPKTKRQTWVINPTKNRKRRTIALDNKTLKLLLDEVNKLDALAEQTGVDVLEDAYIFTNSLDGAEFWIPDTITQYFKRLCKRNGFPDLTFKLLRTFMDTYGQELGYPAAQIALRAGHDPAVASKHYTARVAPTDHAIAKGVAGLIGTKETTRR